MKKLLIPFVVLSALLALGAGAWLAASTTPKATTHTAAQTPSTTASTTTSNPDAYLAVASTSDFTPPIGRAQNPPPASAGERRLMTATSTDGLHFTPTGKILTDQGNVPDLVIDADGALRVYYIGQHIEPGKEESTVMARSTDNGATWEFHTLTFKNLPQPRDPSDPDVVVLPDGTYRMYYTSSISAEKFGIVYADSTDGITFTYGGQSLEGIKNAVDSTTLLVNGVWHMFVLQEEVDGQLHATSTDGKTFTLVDTNTVQLPIKTYIISNPLPGATPVRMFGFSGPEKNIRTFITTDMNTWTMGDIALEADAATTLDTMYLQDLSVAQQTDGTYIMVYVAGLPEEK